MIKLITFSASTFLGFFNAFHDNHQVAVTFLAASLIMLFTHGDWGK